MCLFTKWRIPRITLRRIECYKLLIVDDFGRVFTPYAHYPVSFDETLHDKVKIRKWNARKTADDYDGFAVDSGMFHCFLSIEEAKCQARILYGLISLSREHIPSISFIVAHTTVPLFTRYYRGTYAHTTADSICAKRIRLSSKDTVTVELPEVPEE